MYSLMSLMLSLLAARSEGKLVLPLKVSVQVLSWNNRACLKHEALIIVIIPSAVYVLHLNINTRIKDYMLWPLALLWLFFVIDKLPRRQTFCCPIYLPLWSHIYEVLTVGSLIQAIMGANSARMSPAKEHLYMCWHLLIECVSRC